MRYPAVVLREHFAAVPVAEPAGVYASPSVRPDTSVTERAGLQRTSTSSPSTATLCSTGPELP